MVLNVSATPGFEADTMMQPTSWIRRLKVVAIATPKTPSFGAPNSPNIKTAFRATLHASAIVSSTVATLTFPMHLRIDMYTALIAQKISPGAMNLKYTDPVSMSTSSDV